MKGMITRIAEKFRDPEFLQAVLEILAGGLLGFITGSFIYIWLAYHGVIK